MIVTAKEYTSAAEMKAAAAATHARLMKPKNRFIPMIIALPAPEPRKITKPKARPEDLPRWVRMAITFDSHVRRHNAHIRVMELEANSEIEVFSPTKRSVADIVDDVLADHPEWTVDELKSQKRTRELCLVRQIAMAEVRQRRPDLSLPVIGRWFGGRDHTTVIHALKKIEAMRAGE